MKPRWPVSARTTIILGTDDFREGTWVSPEISEDT